MSLEALKNKIVTTVDASQDEALLQDIVDILLRSESVTNEIYYGNRLEESIRQADAGRVTSASEVHQMARQWITK